MTAKEHGAAERPFTVVDRRFWARGDDAESEPTATKPTYVANLEEQLAERERRLQETLQKHRQAVSEFEDARARLSRDVAQQVEQHKRSILADMLEVADNLDRALQSTGADSDPDGIRRGVTLVRDGLLSKLAAMGVHKLASEGERFDPTKHEAVSTVPVDDPKQDGRVLGVVREAYSIGDDLLRPAMVAVARHSAAQSVED